MPEIQLEMITPMFLHGPDQESLELRPPPFKALFRYWWRALQTATDRPGLYEQEGKLFGDTTHRSPLVIRIPGSPRLNRGPYAPLPHRSNAFIREAFLAGSPFTLTLSSRDFETYAPIVRLSFLLGGVGNRSRRGFGSLADKAWEIQTREELRDSIFATLQQLKPGTFAQQGDMIVSSLPNPGYPVMKKIVFGQCWETPDKVLRHIGQATHQHAGPDIGGVDPRYASPLHVRVQKAGEAYVPIVTQMHSSLNEAKQQAFIDTIVT